MRNWLKLSACTSWASCYVIGCRMYARVESIMCWLISWACPVSKVRNSYRPKLPKLLSFPLSACRLRDYVRFELDFFFGSKAILPSSLRMSILWRNS